MSKRTRTSKIDKWIKEGRGSGIGSDYKGNTNSCPILERNYFYLTEYSDFVIDIREQFPLFPLEDTIVIADELGIKHPTDPKTNERHLEDLAMALLQRLLNSEENIRTVTSTFDKEVYLPLGSGVTLFPYLEEYIRKRQTDI